MKRINESLSESALEEILNKIGEAALERGLNIAPQPLYITFNNRKDFARYKKTMTKIKKMRATHNRKWGADERA